MVNSINLTTSLLPNATSTLQSVTVNYQIKYSAGKTDFFDQL